MVIAVVYVACTLDYGCFGHDLKPATRSNGNPVPAKSGVPTGNRSLD